MTTVDIKSLLGRLNKYGTRCMEGAAGLCVSRTHYQVTVEHFLSKLLEESNVLDIDGSAFPDPVGLIREDRER